jgi:hypothetical protein
MSTLAVIMRSIDEFYMRSGKRAGGIIMSRNTRDAILEEARRSFVYTKDTLPTRSEIYGVPFVVTKFCPDGHVYIFSDSEWNRLTSDVLTGEVP